MYKMFLILLFFILGCSFTKTVGEASIKFDPPSSPIQYVFNVSEVRLAWHYKTSGISSMPTVKLNAEIKGSYEQILILTGSRAIYLDSPYKGRLTGWRNMSFASIIIKNLISDDFINYKISVGHTSVQQDVESVKSLQTGVKPTKPNITCAGAQGEVSNITVREGDDLECLCSSNGLPSPNVLWALPGGKSNGPVLKKEKISRNETNIYTCVANNQYGLHNQSVLDVKVQYPPSLSRVTSSSESSYIGQMVTFTCTGDGDPVPMYSWKTPDNHTSTGNSTLVVLLHSSRQFGMFTCITSNLHGHTTRNITLKQLFVPGKPHFVSSPSKKAFKITITWSEPDDNGGSVITRYFIRVSLGNRIIADRETGTGKLQYEIDKLKRGTTYTFCVWAENIVGNGNETCAEMSTLYEGPPSIPEMPKLTLGDDKLTVKWDEVMGSPDYYVVEYKTKDENMWTRSVKQGTTKLEYEIFTIIPGKIYNVRIVAENSHGVVRGKVAEVLVPTIKPHTSDIARTSKTSPHETTSSTDKPVLGQTSDDVPSTVIVISVLLVLFVIVAVIFVALWLKRRSAGNDRNQPDVEHMAGPLGDLYAVVEGKTKKDKNDRKDLVYAELSDFDPKASNSKPPAPHHTEYADIAHILTEPDNDYEDIPPRSNEGEYASIREVNRSNSISI